MSEEKKLEQQVETLTLALEEAKKSAEENLAGWQRARADYQNLIKENEKRQGELMELINAATVSELLPVYDNFKLALKHIPEEQKNLDWVEGLDFIGKQFKDFFNKFEVEEIKTVGEKFDPEIHEAVVAEAKEGFEPEIIFEEVRPGYLIGGKVLNPAKVKVAK